MISAADILKARILIVDDQAANISVLEQMLDGAGYVSVASTKNPYEVCELHRTKRYDLILLDLQMPGMDGFQVMEGLKKVETEGYLPVLVLTAKPEYKLRALKAGAKDFVSEPFELAEVLLRVYNMLEVRLLHRNENIHNYARLENSQRIAGLGDWEYDFVHQRLIWSEEFHRILGTSGGDSPPTAESFDRWVHPDDLAMVQQKRAATLEEPGQVDFEHRIIRPDGEVRYVHHLTETVFDHQGRPVQRSGTMQDITERIRAEVTFRRSEERYRLMFANNPSPMWVFDRTTFAFLAVNAAAVAHYGYSREEFLRMTAMDIRPLQLVPAFLEREATASRLDREEVRSYHRKKDGTIFPVDVFSHDIDFAGQAARFVSAIDRTESERAASALRDSETRFRSLSESAPLGIFECDATRRVTYYNPVLTALCGRSAEDSIGHNWEETIHPHDRPDLGAGWQRAITTGSPFDQQLQMLRPDGSIRWVRVLAAPSKDGAGRITGFVGTVEDITERRAADAATLESEERYRMLLMLSPNAHFVHVDGLITLVNPAFCELMGAAVSAQLVGRPVLAVVHPVDNAFVRARRLKLLSGHQVPAREIKFVRLDGTTVEVEAASMVFEFRGRQEVQVIARDISSRKKAEAELREKTALLEAQIDSSIDGILVVDSRQKKILQNQRCLELWKVPREIVDQSFEKQVQFMRSRPKNAEALLERDLYLYAHPDETSREEIELVDGTVLDRHSSPVRGKDGKHYGRIWAFHDITARKATENALRESEERFKLVARAMSDAVWDWNLLNDTIWWNDSFLTTFGYAAADINPGADSWTSRIHPDERSRVVDSVRHAIDTGAESWAAEYRFQRKDGSHAFVEDRGYILRDAAGKGVRMVGGMRDLTQQKKMEAQFLRAQRMESIGTLAGGISHDLNNVLAPIMMAIELLKLDWDIDPRRTKILDSIYISCRRGADLVRQVLSFARGLDGQRVAVRLRDVINDLKGIIGETFASNIQIVVKVPDDIWPITGDPTQIQQVLLNLAVNARDAMPKGGTLTLTVSNITIDAQYVGMAKASTNQQASPGPYLLLEVTDTGCGMPPEVRARIFEPFFTTKEIGKGTGIGLATVHSIVKSHGGFIGVYSEVGNGTTFKIYLPADCTRGAADSVPPVPEELSVGRNELILVVDDEFSIRDIARQTLEAFGYCVITASNGLEAVAIYAQQAQEISVVLTDMMMPLMDGPTMIRELMEINPAVKIIATSGLDVSHNVEKATREGVKKFLPKPYTAETLLKLLRAVIDLPDSLPQMERTQSAGRATLKSGYTP